MMRKKRRLRRGWLGDVISYAYLTILAVIAAFPLLWILLSSVKSKGELTGNPTAILPKEITFDFFKTVLGQLHFNVNIVNSIIVAGCTTLIAITISALGAYGVVRFFPKFGKVLTRVLITTYMFPPILLAVPYSIIMGKAGMMNNRAGLIIVYLSFAVPYAVWLLVGFFQTVPLEIEEAARVDGANKLQVFGKVVLPIVAPGVVAVAIYTLYQRLERVPLLPDFNEQQRQNDCGCGAEIFRRAGSHGLGRHDGRLRPGSSALRGLLHADPEENSWWVGTRFH